MDVGPFVFKQPNPTHQLMDPTQPNQRRNSFIRGPPVRFGRGPYLYIFIKSHMLINWDANIVLVSRKKRFFSKKKKGPI